MLWELSSRWVNPGVGVAQDASQTPTLSPNVCVAVSAH